MQTFRHIAQNASHTVQNNGSTCKMSAAPGIMSAATHLMFAKDQRGGLMCPPGPQAGPPTPILEKTFVSRNDF